MTILKSIFLFHVEMEYHLESRDAYRRPPVLRLALEFTSTDSLAFGSKHHKRGENAYSFTRMLHAVCVEALSELALLLLHDSSASLDTRGLLAAVNSLCGAQQLGTLTIISESLLFSKLPSKARICALKHVASMLLGTTSSTSAHETPLNATSTSLVQRKEDDMPVTQNSTCIQSKVLTILMDVAMLDPVSRMRIEAMKAFEFALQPEDNDDNNINDIRDFEIKSSLLRLGGKDLLRVAIFKCRDTCTEVRSLAFTLLKCSLQYLLRDRAKQGPHKMPNVQQSQNDASGEGNRHSSGQGRGRMINHITKPYELSPEEFIAVTKQLLQVTRLQLEFM